MKLRIRPRMIAGFLVMSALLIIVGVFVVYFTDRMQRNTSRILAENVSSLKSAEELEIALLDMKGLTSNYLINGHQQWLDIFSSKKDTFYRWFNQARDKAHTSDEEKILDTIEILFSEYLKLQSQVVLAYQQGSSYMAYNLLTNDMLGTFNKLYERCEELLFLNEKLMYSTSRIIEQDNRTVNRIMFSVGIMGILMGLAMGLFLARGITHSIYELVLKVRGATSDELVEKVDIANETELEHLSKHVRKLIDKVHEANKDLERSQRMLIRSEKLAALGRMSAGLAHEIRNPLTAINMLIFTLQRDSIKGQQKHKDFDIILKEIERMEIFLQNFLDFARPPEPNFSVTDLNENVKQALNLLSGQINNANIQLVEKLDAINAKVYADREQLQIVFVNIILNAIQSMAGKGQLTVESKIETAPVDSVEMVQIIFRDTGSGIRAEIIDSIFDPFVTGKEGGIGLGLSTTNQIIHNHGGWIEAANNSDQGATFTINLPIKEL